MNLATRQSIAIFAIVVIFYLSTILLSVYIAVRYFTDFITSRHYHELPEPNNLKVEQKSDLPEDGHEVFFRRPTKKIRNITIFQLICGGMTIIVGIADLFLFQGLYSNQTFYAGSLVS